MKTCVKCKQTKNFSEFYSTIGKKEQRRVDGKKYYHSYCKECLGKSVKSNPNKISRCIARTTNPLLIEKMRLSDRDYHRRFRRLFPEKKRAESKQYYRVNKIKVLAHARVYKAIKNGDLIRKNCRDCDRKDVHGHHSDYSRPLDVVWLCPVHHKLEHLKLSTGGRPVAYKS